MLFRSSVSYRFYIATVAINATVADDHCTLLHAREVRQNLYIAMLYDLKAAWGEREPNKVATPESFEHYWRASVQPRLSSRPCERSRAFWLSFAATAN